MPAKSEKQRRTMEGAKHDPESAKKIGISPKDAAKVLGEGESVPRSSPRIYRAAGAKPGPYRKV